MPYVLFYADEKDLTMIHDYFNQHPEVAFIIAGGQRRWRAEMAVTRLRGSSVALWHVPGGPLPLLHPPPSKKEDRIRDPWSGWRELSPGADRSCPYFGAGHPGIIWLNRKRGSKYVKGGVGMSSFEWIGGYYSVAGSKAKKVTEAFWKDLRRWVKEKAILIPRKGRVGGPHREIWAFPSALAAFQRGRARDEDWL